MLNRNLPITLTSCVLIMATLCFTSYSAIAKRNTDVWQSSPFVTKIDPQRNFRNVPLPPETIKHLKIFTQHMDQRSASKSTNRRLLRTLPNTIVLFTGLNSKGKLAASEAIATELKRPLYTVNVSKLETKYIGETEKNLAMLFRKAETQGAILLFDEADALFGKRTDVSDTHDKYANIETNYLIPRMKKYNGLVILSTNTRSIRTSSDNLTIHTTIAFPCAVFRGCK